MTEASIPDPLLGYSMRTDPDPIEVSTPVTLTFVVSGPTTTRHCTVSQITINLPVGDPKDATNLTAGKPENVSISSSDNDHPWTHSAGVSDGTFIFKPPGGSILFGDQSLTIEMTGIQVSPLVGTAQITILEWAAPGSSPAPSPDDNPPSGRKVEPAAKFPQGFFAADFAPDRAEIYAGETATLTWVGEHADYAIDPGPDHVIGHSWTTGELYDTTVFVLTASATEGGQTVKRRQTTGVTVIGPEVKEFYATPSQIDAQDWITLNWRAVHADGVHLYSSQADTQDLPAVSPDPHSDKAVKRQPAYGDHFYLQAYKNKGQGQDPVLSLAAELPYAFNKLDMTFTASLSTVTDHQSTTLSWTVRHGKPVKYQGGEVPAVGHCDEHPTSDTTYKLEATWVDGKTVEAKVPVTVLNVPGDGYPSWMTGNFTGSGKSQLLWHSSGPRWGLGALADSGLGWTAIEAAPPDVDTKGALTWVADFTGDDQSQIMSYSPSDRKWRLGSFTGTSLSWTEIGWNPPEDAFSRQDRTWAERFFSSDLPVVASYSPGNQMWWVGRFVGGDIPDSFFLWDWSPNAPYAPGDPTWASDFTGDGYSQILFCSSDDQSWWRGTLWQVHMITWVKASDALSQFHYDQGDPTWVGDFTGAGKAQVLTCKTTDSSHDQYWWLGTFTGTHLGWAPACNTKGFGYNPANHPTWIGDFTGAGKAQVLFCFSGDQHWWLGTFTGTHLGWDQVGDTSSQFHYDLGDPTWAGDFTGAGRSQILRYSPAHQSWWLGTFTGTSLSWNPVA